MLMRNLLFVVLCTALALPLAADEWPQWRGPNRDGVWNETGVLDSFPAPQLGIAWRAPVANGYSGPTVANGRVYLTDRPEDSEQERVLCFDAATGTALWSFAYDCGYSKVGYPDGPRACVTLDDGRAYALGTMGNLHCLDAATGSLVWKKTPGEDYDITPPIWGIASAPLVYGDLLIVQLGAKPDACIVALDKVTGEEQWRALGDDSSYSAPIIIQQAGRDVLLCWTGENLAALEPATGAQHWKMPTPAKKMIINVPTPILSGNRIFVSSFYDGACLFRYNPDAFTVEQVWNRSGKSERDTDALHCMIGTGIFEGEYIYGADSYGQLRCLEAATGDRIWEDLTAVPSDRWATIHMVRNGGRVWMFNERGELIIATLSPEGFGEISRAQLIQPTEGQLGKRGGVCWSHPAFANRHVYARNDNELVCADVSAK